MLSLLLVGVFFASNTQDADAFFCGAGCSQGSTEVTKTAADNDGVSERVTTYKMDNGETVTSTRTFNSRTNSETVTDSTGKTVTNYYGGGGGGGTTAVLSGAGVRESVSTGAAAGASSEELKKMIEQLQKRVAALTKQIQAKKTTKTTKNTNTPAGTSGSSEARSITKNLGVGSKGAQVTSLQQCLSDLGYFDEGDMDPTYGPKTRQAVKQFQTAEGIASSGNEWTTGYGYVGPKTRNKLNSQCADQ